MKRYELSNLLKKSKYLRFRLKKCVSLTLYFVLYFTLTMEQELFGSIKTCLFLPHLACKCSNSGPVLLPFLNKYTVFKIIAFAQFFNLNFHSIEVVTRNMIKKLLKVQVDQFLINMGELMYAIYTFQGVTSHFIRAKTQEVRDRNIVKEVLKSKQIEIASQIRRQGQLLRAIRFEVFPYFIA